MRRGGARADYGTWAWAKRGTEGCVHGLSPGGGIFPPLLRAEARARLGHGNGCTRVGGREGPMGVGFRGLTVSATPNFIRGGARGLYP